MFPTAHVHGHFGIESTVVLVELLALHHLSAIFAELYAVRLIDAGNVGAGNIVDCSVRDDDIGTGVSGVHILCGCLRICGAAFIDVVENHSGGHGAGDVHAVQNQRHHGIRVLLRVLSQVHSHLSGGQAPAENIGPGLCDMDHHVSVRLLPDVFVGFGTFAVSDALTLQIEHNIVGGINGGGLTGRRRFAVHGNALVRQRDSGALILFCRCCSLAAGRQGYRQHQSKHQCNHSSHVATSFAVDGYRIAEVSEISLKGSLPSDASLTAAFGRCG